MKPIALCISAFMAAVSLGSPLAAQAVDPVSAVEIVVASDILGRKAPDEQGNDRGLLDEQAGTRQRTKAARQALTDAVNIPLVKADTIHTCEDWGRPETCRIRHTTRLVTISAVYIMGDSAVAHVTILRNSGIARIPVHDIRYRYVLKWDGTKWDVAHKRIAGQS